MEDFNYNYQQIQIPKNYPIENSINGIQSNYIKFDSNTLNNYPNYEIKTFSQNEKGFNFNNNIYNIQTTNITNINYPKENHIINKGQNMKKTPKDAQKYIDKIPKDNMKGKQNIVHKNSLKKYDNNNQNKINRIEYKLYKNNNKEEKQPKDNYKKYSNEVEYKHNDIKRYKLNIKININDNNVKEKINGDKHYLKTNQSYVYGYNPKKTSKRNSKKTIDRIKDNNLISINDVFINKKIINRKSQDSKEKNPKKIHKSTNKINKVQNNKKSLNTSLSKDQLKEKSDSNFASLINKKKLKMFPSFKLIHNNNPINSIYEITETNPDKIASKKKQDKNIRTIVIKKNHGRLYSPQLTSPSKRIIGKEKEAQIEIKKTKEIFKNKQTYINTNKEFKTRIISITTKKKINNNNNTSNNSILKNRASSLRTLTEKNSGSLNKKIIEENWFNNKENENEDNYDIMTDFIQRAYNRKSENLKKFNEKVNVTNSVNKEKNNSKKKQKTHITIKKQFSLKNKKKTNNDENEIDYLYNPNSIIATRKKVIYYRGKDINDKKGLIMNQKRNLYTFMRKTQRKNSNYSYNKLTEGKNNMHNKSYKGFSSVKKLEEIKKKYKFYPHSKESKKLSKDKYINNTSESIDFIKLMNSTNLNNKPDEVRNLNLTEFLQKKDINKIEEDYESKSDINVDKDDKENLKITENEEVKEEENEKDENEEDLLNHKSFILNLNNVISINEKKLRDTINKENIIIKMKPEKENYY